jgi:hypothetical protein
MMWMRPSLAARRVLLLLPLLLPLAACPGHGPEPAAGSETTAGEDPMITTAGSSLAGESTSMAETSSSGATTTEAASSGGTTTEDATSSDTMSTSDTGVMPPAPKSCALAVIDPAADPAAVIDAGDGAGQIPTLVGEVLLRNCGCHYTDDVPIGLYVDYTSNKQPLATHADFHANFMGTFPMGFERMPAYLAVEQRVVAHVPLPMPPYGCGVVGEPGMITAADLALLSEWLAAAAPDGASFP